MCFAFRRNIRKQQGGDISDSFNSPDVENIHMQNKIMSIKIEKNILEEKPREKNCVMENIMTPIVFIVPNFVNIIKILFN